MAGPLIGLAGFAGTLAGAKLAQTLDERRRKAAPAPAPAPPKSPAKGRERPDEGFATNKRLSPFETAFARARASGKDVFEFEGKKYTTKLASEVKPYKKGGLVTKAPVRRK
jgi:hypothetical protein